MNFDLNCIRARLEPCRRHCKRNWALAPANDQTMPPGPAAEHPELQTHVFRDHKNQRRPGLAAIGAQCIVVHRCASLVHGGAQISSPRFRSHAEPRTSVAGRRRGHDNREGHAIHKRRVLLSLKKNTAIQERFCSVVFPRCESRTGRVFCDIKNTSLRTRSKPAWSTPRRSSPIRIRIWQGERAGAEAHQCPASCGNG